MNTAMSFDDTGEGHAGRPLLEQSVKGEVTHIIFAGDDSDYAVVEIRESSGKTSVMVGSIAGLYEGQDIKAEGRWEHHRQHGRQFRVSHYEAILPTTEDGVRRYLASGIIPGIREKLAQRIVDRFGTDTLNVLDRYSSRLTEVPGFGKGRLKTVRDAWLAQSERRDVYIFLQGLGISAAFCDRIFRRYGAATTQAVSDNPYCLASDVKGIGFKTADAIARRLDIARDNPFRLGAGTVYVLTQLAEQGGHTCYPRSLLTEKTAAVLDVDDRVAANGLERAVLDGAVIIDGEGCEPDQEFVFNSELFIAEHAVADAVRTIRDVRRQSFVESKQLPHADSWAMLNSDQQAAVVKALQFPISIITGGPGVGKTTVTQTIVDISRKLGERVLLAASTGRAAKRLSESTGTRATTIHRLLKWEPDRQFFVYNSDNPLKCDLLIVDEVSMLDIKLAAALLGAVSASTRLVLIGDCDQLPSVGPGAFLNDLIQCKDISVTHLLEVYRQAANSRIIANARALNAGRFPELETPPGATELYDFYWIDQEDPERAADVITRMVAERIPQRFGFSPMTDIQILSPMNRGVCGAVNLNNRLQTVLNPGDDRGHGKFQYGDTTYRIGDRVMQVVNNYDSQVFNGDMGRIINIEPQHRRFGLQVDTGTVTYSMDDADQIRLAYAITIHKSQGNEFPAVIVPLLNQHYVMLQRNLVYTAMTRARQLLILVGSRKALSMAVNNVNRTPRYSRLAFKLSRVS